MESTGAGEAANLPLGKPRAGASMVWRPAGLVALGLMALAIGSLLGACNTPPQDVAIQGGPDGVIIRFVGDVAATLPIAKQHCARYERVPVLHETKEERVVYFCIKPPAGS
jgi:hypothetical protein